MHTTHTTTSRTGRRNFFGRRQRVQHTKRHATIGDKISGALMKLRGSLTRNPGVKVSSLTTLTQARDGVVTGGRQSLTLGELGCRNPPHARHRRPR